MSTDNQTEGVVYNENSKGPRTEPWRMPNRSLQTSDYVEATKRSGMIYGVEGTRQVEQHQDSGFTS